MRRKVLNSRILTGLFAFALLVAMLPAVKAEASANKTYTVTYRPGNVGYFAIEKNDEGDVQAMAQAVADQLYGESATATAKGAIKITVPQGGEMPQAPAYIQIKGDNYFAKSASEWGPAKDGAAAVTQNVDYVVDYSRLVNGVEYTIRYTDRVSGESIAPSVTAKASDGYEVKSTAPSVIVLSANSRYRLVSDAESSIVLKAEQDNILTFEYEFVTGETTVTEIVTETDGGTIVTTETNTVYIDNGTTTEGGTAAPGGGGAAAADAGVPAEVIEIEDEETPLADLPDAAGEETASDSSGSSQQPVTIEDEETPLASFEQSGMNPAVWIVLASIAALGAAGAAWIAAQRRQRKVSEEAGSKNEDTNKE